MLEKAYHHLIASLNPEKLTINFFKKNALKHDLFDVLAIGKASIPMAGGFSQIYPVSRGLIVSPYMASVPENFELCLSSHPDIGERSLFCAKKVVNFLKESNNKMIVLLSGGGSALIEIPLDFLTIDEVRCVNRLLLRSGIPIEEVNFMRIHLSRIKGGGLSKFISGPSECFVLCDVLNNRIDRVSSAPFYRIERDYNVFFDKADRFGLWNCIPRSKRGFFETGCSIEGVSIPHTIMASNRDCVDFFSDFFMSDGLFFKKEYDFVFKDVEVEAEKMFNIAKELNCGQGFVAGGEAVVNVKGNGIGGRTTELGLRFIKRFVIRKFEMDMEFLFATTDGVDGNSGCAGVYVSRDTFRRICRNESVDSIDSYLLNSNSASFFKKYDCLITTGPTYNNLLDVYAFFVFQKPC